MKRRSELAAPMAAETADDIQRSAAKPARRALRRDRVRAELIAAGLELFGKKGFEATTVNDVVDAVGISPRSFFRYFKTKEDLAFDWMDLQGEVMRPVLTARPHSEPPLQAMEEAFLHLAEFHDANRKRTGFLTRLIFDTPSLSGRYHQDHAKWEDEFVDILLRARSLPAEEVFALRVQVSAAITAFVVAIRAWAAEPRKTPLKPWVNAAFSALNGAAAIAALPSAAQTAKAKTAGKRRN